MAAPTRIDAYSHIGLPRFQTFADHRHAMAANGIGRVVLSAFASSPDLGALHEALRVDPDHVRILGVPLGRDRHEIEAAARAQLASGFSGLRLTDDDVLQRGWLLDLLAEHDAVTLVAGGGATSDAVAARLRRHLDEHERAVVVAGHFGGVASPDVLASGPRAELFASPRFSVVFSRHGAYPSDAIRAWAAAIVERHGWSRVLWGAEAPVLYWRGETIGTALDWIDALGPTDTERAAFFGGNAERLYFSRPAAVRPLELPFDPWARAEVVPATLWSNGLPVEQALASRLVRAWFDAGGPDREPLGDFAARILRAGLPADDAAETRASP